MGNERKRNAIIYLRVEKELKEKWQNIADDNGCYLSDFLISSVENKMLHSDKKKVLNFIENQVNVFSKIENNINQIARLVNTEKAISKDVFNLYLIKLDELNKLKNEQNNLIKNVLKTLAI